MSLEKTVLDKDVIKQLAKQHYQLNIENVRKTNLGTANCYILTDKNNRYFLKEFQSNFCSDDLVREANVVNYLSNKGVPTAKYIKTLSDRLFIVYKNHLVCLEEYIDGITYGYDNFPSKLLFESAKMLSNIHNSLSEYELPIDMGKEWLESFSVEKEQIKYTELSKILEKHKDDKYYERIKDDLIYKQKLLSKGNDYIKYFDNITYKATHGDYQGCQLICEREHIKAVIDFSSARKLPAVWEIMRSYVQTSVYSRENALIDVEEFCEYVREYMKYAILTEEDLKAIPYVYLFQLARSSYGYPQYLATDSEDREGLLKFAFWRTDICKEVENKAEIIVKKLNKLK